jgi:hypothetical protein
VVAETLILTYTLKTLGPLAKIVHRTFSPGLSTRNSISFESTEKPEESSDHYYRVEISKQVAKVRAEWG